ncbi:hypothetical protein EJ110_NYTH35746 [Nymphaea thermarum]|nr:hypothetical protein EJ110_NYTH35746 [Nymphaea thermarum]
MASKGDVRVPPLPSGEQTVWVDVSALLQEACTDIQGGELIHGENFSLFAAMSALESHRSWRRAFFVDRSSWKLPSLNAVEVPASVFRLQPIRAAVLLLGTPPPRDPCRRLGFRAQCRLGDPCRCLGIRAAALGFALLPRVSRHRLEIHAHH